MTTAAGRSRRAAGPAARRDVLVPVLIAGLLLLTGGCGATSVVVRGPYAAVWHGAKTACSDAGYTLVDREHDGFHFAAGLIELSHHVRFLQGERVTLSIQYDHPAESIAREVRIAVREENTVVFLLTLGLAGNQRLPAVEAQLARAVVAEMPPDG
jgi:hypothetical protein